MERHKNDVYVRLGRRLRRFRHEKHITQEDLAYFVDVSKTTIYNIESGRKAMRIETLVALCNALEITADAVLADSLECALAAESHELSEMLSDCTVYERRVLLEVLRTTKISLRSNYAYFERQK